MLSNLMLNSVDAMIKHDGDERRIEVYASDANDGFVEISGRDTGPGVTDNVALQVFNAFLSTKSEGIGMGLAICRTKVDSHGGQLTLASAERADATFQLTVPKSKTHPPETLNETEHPAHETVSRYSFPTT